MSYLRQNSILLLVLLFTAFLFMDVKAQLSGNNLLEYQLGNLPETEPGDLSTLYNQTNLFYNSKKVDVYLRLEQFYSSDSAANNYIKPSLYRIEYSTENLSLQVGNIFETLGRGLLFRTYDIKGAVLEDNIFRQRKGFYKDLQGVKVNYHTDWFEITAIRGKVLDNLLPVDNEYNRSDLVEAVNPSVSLFGQTAGVVLLRHVTDYTQKTYASFYAEGNLPYQIGYFGEYAKALDTGEGILHTGFSNETYGGYAGLSYSVKGLGVSFEIKDYKRLALGSGFTSPPTLVKEHSYRTLNRSTHISEISDESGYQLELFYFFPSGDMLTVNNAWAKNEFALTSIFREYFAEYALNRFDKLKTKAFVDYSIDEFTFEPQRIAAGVYTDIVLAKGSYSLETEYQHITRDLFGPYEVHNIYVGLIARPTHKLTLTLNWESTTDPYLADLRKTETIESQRNYLDGQVFYRLNAKNTVQLFVGQRRGGPACTSGVCYNVLDFEGIEFRLSTKF